MKILKSVGRNVVLVGLLSALAFRGASSSAGRAMLLGRCSSTPV